MARPLRLHVPGTLYHVMSRGNGKQKIFLNDSDYRRFLDLLEKAANRFDVECCAYCLMPTHYHVILRPGREPLSRMMQQLNSTYGGHFNRSHERVGHVFQGRFKSVIVEGDVYFLTLLRYTMKNPVAANLAKVPSAWRWSSYRATAGLCAAPSFLAVQAVWSTFDSTDVKRAQQRFVQFIALRDGSTPLLETLIFGSPQFVEGLAPKLEAVRDEREYTYAHRFAARPPLSALLAEADSDRQRKQAVRDAFSRHAYTLRQIAAAIGRHPGTVWRWIQGGDGRTRRLLKIVRSLDG